MALTRRDLLATGAMALAGLPARGQTAASLQLRLLGTSDLHMFALDWDYCRERPDPTVGLDRIATLIAKARAETPNTVLFDNGDLIQGNPLGDYLADAAKAARPDATHPMIRAMNSLRYDAATLGNHEFNFGLDFMERALKGADFPYVSANVERANGESYLPPFCVLEREMRDETGAAHKLRLGVIGFAPPQIMMWDKAHLAGRIACADILAAARRHIPALRKTCDVLVALCHAGINAHPAPENEENASLQLAAIPGIDAIFMGHAHRVFPGPDYAGRANIDALRGTLNGVPAVMPGFWGSHLGVVDLSLVRREEGWKVEDFRVEARPIYRREGSRVVSLAEPAPEFAALVAPEHEAAKAWVDAPIGHLATPLNSFFVWTGYDPVTALVNAAQLAYAGPLLAATPYADLPRLSAAAPFKAGYTPDAFIDLPAGPVALRHVADIYPYPNTVVAVRVDGAALREWLECAARVFNRIDPAQAAPQELLDKRAPSYNFDAILGVTYEIDLAQPARYDGAGKIVDPNARRIVNLRFAERPVEPSQQFIVVTNNYRADGGGKFPGLDGSAVVLRAPDANRDAIQRFVAEGGRFDGDAAPWRFARLGRRVTVAFDSARAAEGRIGARTGLKAISGADAGYARLAFDLE
jgi:2',3'-cyclic-nucleotide 2'-phosphodiesterase / 3'-nucleotidase